MFSLLLEIKTECSSCGNPLPVNAYTENVFCDKCNKENTFNGGFWHSVFEDKLKDIKGFKDSEGRNSKIMGQYNIDMLFGRKNARCDECKTDIPDEEFVKFTESGKYKCAKCSAEIFIRPATDSLKSFMPSACFIVGEDENMLMSKSEKPLKPESAKPVLYTCPSCAGSLEIDGKERIVVCKYCDSKVYLPDDLWFSLHPVVSKKRWYITFDNKSVSEMLPDWDNIYDAVIDVEGNLYFATKLDTFDKELTIWSCTSDLKKRWSVNNLNVDKQYSHIAVTGKGNLYVWDSTKHSLYLLSGKDGSVIKKTNGGAPTKDNPYAFSMNCCETLISDSDDTILALINSTFVRFNPDGTRASLWGSSTGGESQGFFSKLFSGSDDEIKIPESGLSDSPELEKAENKPRTLSSGGTKMFLGWDGFMYIYKIRDGRVAIAKYSRSGEQLWNKVIELNETGDKIGVDGKGNIFIVGIDENKKSVMLRLSSDGTSVDAILKDITDGGTLMYDDGDIVLVSSEGVIYTVNSGGALRSFNPDYSVKFISSVCKEDGESTMEDFKSGN